MQTLNLRLTRDNLSRPWGFRLQGGSDTSYPLSVQRVFSGSPAEGILQRHDEIKIINNCHADNLTYKEVQDIIRTSGSQLNFIVVRDPNTNYNNEEKEEKVSVKAARMKFLNDDHRAPQPFGQFGTQYQKKYNTLPTGLKIDTRNEFSNKEDRKTNFNEMDDDDIADYNFMKLPVSERKKLFAFPNKQMLSKTVPRQRSQSFRPSQKSHQTLPKTQTTVFLRKPQEYGWSPSPEKMERAKRVSSNQSAVPLKYQNTLTESPRVTKPQFETVKRTYYSNNQINPTNSQTSRRFSWSTSVPVETRHIITSSGLNSYNNEYDHQLHANKVKSQTKHIYHCRQNEDTYKAEPSIVVIPSNRQPQNLYVHTYRTINQPKSPVQSPRYFRPAYPAFSTDNSAVDNMSTISVRSEPYYKRFDKNLSYEKTGSYRINRDSASVQRDYPQKMSTLQIGEPRTRIIANPASPSCHLNWSFWGPDGQVNKIYEPPSQIHQIQHVPKIVDSRPFHNETIKKSHSTLVINPNRMSNEYVNPRVSWNRNHRDSMDGVSDF